jgi:hypothetical protein
MGNSHKDFWQNPAATMGESSVAVGVEKKGDDRRFQQPLQPPTLKQVMMGIWKAML